MPANTSTFDLTLNEADKIISEVTAALNSIHKYAANAGIKKAKQKSMLKAIGFKDSI